MSPWKPYQWRIGVSYQARAPAARSLCVSHEEIATIDSHQETQGRVYFTFSLFLQPRLSFILPSLLHAICSAFEKALQSDVTRENAFTALCDKAKNSWTVASEFCRHQSHKREVTRQKETGWDISHQNRRYTIKCMFKNYSVNFFGSWGINDSLPDALGTIKDDRVIILADGTCLQRGYYIAHAHFTVRVFEMSLFRLWIVLFRHSVGSTSEHASVF